MKSIRMVMMGLALAVSGCATLVPYMPDPTGVRDPQGELEGLLAENSGGAITQAEFKPNTMIVKSIGNGGVSQQSLRYRDIVRIDVLDIGYMHGVKVFDADGTAVFSWGVRTISDAKRLADALTALANHPVSRR